MNAPKPLLPTKNWAAIDPRRIATTCSPRHVQSVLEDAQRDIAALVAERDALLAKCREALDAWTGDGPPIVLDSLRAVIAKAEGRAP